MTSISEGAKVRPAHRGLRHPTIAFFVLAFGVAWAAWGPVAAESRGYVDSPAPQSAASLVVAFAPTLAAIGLTVFNKGGSGLRWLLGRLLKWRVPVGW